MDGHPVVSGPHVQNRVNGRTRIRPDLGHVQTSRFINFPNTHRCVIDAFVYLPCRTTIDTRLDVIHAGDPEL